MLSDQEAIVQADAVVKMTKCAQRSSVSRHKFKLTQPAAINAVVTLITRWTGVKKMIDQSTCRSLTL
jgi:hypothetical protein